MQEQLEKVEDLIKAEVNIKEIQYLSGDNDFIRKKVKPNFVLLGKKLGSKMKQVSGMISALRSGGNQATGNSRGTFVSN